MTSALRTSTAILALSGIYFCAGKLGLSLAFIHASASAVWPPSGIAFAALLLYGYRLWPGIFLGAFLVNITTQGSLATCLAIATGNTLEALLGAWAVNRFANGPKTFERARSVFKFILLAPILSTVVSATIGVGSLNLGGYAQWENCAGIWFTWWVGDAVGDLIVAPFVLIWLTPPYVEIKTQRALEAAGLLLSVVLATYLMFIFGTPASSEYMTILPLLWAAFRFGPRGVVTAALILSGIALAGTLKGVGPFAHANPNDSLLHLQSFMGTSAIAALVLASVIAEGKRVEQRLVVQNAISSILAQSPALNEAAARVIQVLCERAGWDLGAVWNMDRATGNLISVEVWHLPSVAAPEFEAATKTGRFTAGTGLPGRVWNSGQAAWIPDVAIDKNFRRAPAAIKEGLHGAFAFPIKLGSNTLGIVECFSREVREPDDNFLHMVNDIGAQLGQYFERKRAEDLLRQAKDDLVKANEDLERRVRERTAELERANAALLRTLEEQKQLEEQLRHAQKMESMGTLAGGIAHDFNNILNIIRGYATLIGQQRSADGQIHDSLKVIDQEIERGASVVQQLMTVARKSETRLIRADVNDIVLTVNQLVKTFPKIVTVALELDPSLSPVLADPNKLSQALLNICVNARDAMPAGGNLTIKTAMVDASQLPDHQSADLTERFVCVAISDTGTGIREEVRRRIFEPFFTTKGVGKGTGLGLAIVYGILKEHNGYIDVASQVGRGTTFRLYLPALKFDDRTVAVTVKEKASVPTQRNGRGTVLVVEDEENLVLLLNRLLPQAGFQVLAAMDGEQAIELYRAHQAEIDLVLLDLGLPKISGLDVIGKLQEQNRGVKIMITTGYVAADLKTELFRAGVLDCIHKPYVIDDIIAKIGSLLEGSQP
jgi:signal transduction histidine kinase/integral membrane sensor domain MASE1/ActR/RegA family two-component response regulator